METITLYKARSAWMMQTTDKEVIELFGTNILPTAYTTAAPAPMVLAAIRKLNPTAIVNLK